MPQEFDARCRIRSSEVADHAQRLVTMRRNAPPPERAASRDSVARVDQYPMRVGRIRNQAFWHDRQQVSGGHDAREFTGSVDFHQVSHYRILEPMVHDSGDGRNYQNNAALTKPTRAVGWAVFHSRLRRVEN